MLTQRQVFAVYDALVLALFGGMLAMLFEGCPNWQRPACPTPGRYSCVHDQPYYCAPTRELTPIGDEPCAAQGRACALASDGIAYCTRLAPTADGGTP